MKKITFIISLFLIAFSINARAQAITFDSSNAPKAGTVWYTVNDTVYAPLSVTAGGAKQVWKYDTALHHADTSVLAFKKASTSKFSKLYPKSTLVYTNNANDSAPYFEHSNVKGVFVDGGYSNNSLYTDTAFSISPEMIFPFGITYLDSVKNIGKFISKADIFGTKYIDKIKYTQNYKADAYGSLTTPSGKYSNILRLKCYSVQTDSSYSDSANILKLQGIYVTRSTTFQWIQNNPKQPVVMTIYLDSNLVINGASYTFIKGTGVTNLHPVEANILIFPNPVCTVLTIHPELYSNIYNAQLVNILGQTVWQGAHLSGDTHIPVSRIANGIYLCHITENGATVTKQIEVNHQ